MARLHRCKECNQRLTPFPVCAVSYLPSNAGVRGFRVGTGIYNRQYYPGKGTAQGGDSAPDNPSSAPVGLEAYGLALPPRRAFPSLAY
jgi:hypothetical protein